MVIPAGAHRTVTPTVPRLALDGIKRQYGPVTALDGATLTVWPGEVHALLGENGAGKSTLMKIVFGLDQPDAGTIRLDGQAITLPSPRDAMRLGIGMVQQHFALVEAMTVAENVALGGVGHLDLRAVASRLREISHASGLDVDPDAIVRDLPVGAQQRVEILKALARESRTLILDEPTAVLAPQEAAELLSWTRRFAESGGTVVLIAHKLREVLSVADRVTVLRRGRTVLSAPASDVNEDTLTDAMLGVAQRHVDTNVDHTPRLPSATDSAPVLAVHAVTVQDTNGVSKLRQATLSVQAGEIVGVAAVEGAGQHELLRVLAGRRMPDTGRVTRPAIVGFVPEDRHRDAIVLDATLTENVALGSASGYRGVMPWSALRTTTEALMSARDVRAADATVPIRTLSGGNQQKLVLGRELAVSPTALVVENPTRGLDIRATRDVHAALRSARDAGMAVVVYSSDLDEVLALADRMVVVTGGVVRDVTHDRDAVGRAMLAADA